MYIYRYGSGDRKKPNSKNIINLFTKYYFSYHHKYIIYRKHSRLTLYPRYI